VIKKVFSVPVSSENIYIFGASSRNLIKQLPHFFPAVETLAKAGL